MDSPSLMSTNTSYFGSCFSTSQRICSRRNRPNSGRGFGETNLNYVVFNDLILSSEHNEMRGDANLRSGVVARPYLKLSAVS